MVAMSARRRDLTDQQRKRINTVNIMDFITCEYMKF
jgi:hypothetical protein